MRREGIHVVRFPLLILGLMLAFGLAACDTISLSDATPATLLKVYGGSGDEEGRAVALAPDGGYYIFGTTESFGAGQEDFYLVRTDNQGVELWAKTYGGTGIDSGRAMIATNDGGALLVGTSFSFTHSGFNDVYVVKVNSDGDTLWTRNFGSTNPDVGTAVLEVPEGYLIAGSTTGFNAVQNDFYAVLVDRQGGKIWEKSYPGGKDEILTDLTKSAEGYLMTGWIVDVSQPQIYMTRIDSAGNYIIGKSPFFPKGVANAGYMVEDTALIFFGFSRNISGREDSLLLLKTNLTADRFYFPSSRSFGGGGSGANDGFPTADGGYIAVGASAGFGRGADLFVVKTSRDGLLEWSRAYGGERDEEGKAVLQTPDGGYVFVGTTRSVVRGTNGSDIILLKTNASGELVE
jgi:hypothetical protein